MSTAPTVVSEGWGAGLKIGAGLGLGALALAVSFGAFAVANGWPPWLVIVMSAVVFSGSAQFALITAMTGAGGLVAGLGAAALINARFLPMAAASAPYLKGGLLRRALEGQTVVDGSWVAAHRPDGSLDRAKMFGATAIQWPAWVVGTAVGALLSPSADFLRTIGLDVVFPSFFLVLLLDALRSTRSGLVIAVLATGLAVAAVAVLPAGVALLISGLAAVLAAVRPRARP